MQKLLAAALLLCVPAVALAAPIKLGIVDFDHVFSQTEASKVDRQELTKLMAQKQAEVDRGKAKLEADRAELAERAQKLDAVARQKREAELDLEQQALHKLFDEAQAAVQARERELSKRVVDDARALAPEIGREHGVDAILGAAEALLWTAPNVVKVDLTAEVSRALDVKRGISGSR